MTTGDFAIEDGASPEGVTESAGSCSSLIADSGSIGAIFTYWITYCHLTGLLEISQGLAVKVTSVQWWYIEGPPGRVCVPVFPSQFLLCSLVPVQDFTLFSFYPFKIKFYLLFFAYRS